MTGERHAGTGGGGRTGENQTRLAGRAGWDRGPEEGDGDDCERPYPHVAEDCTDASERLGPAVTKLGGAIAR